MIHTIRTVAVGDQESKIDSPIILYRGDREVEVEFTINGSKFTFTNGGNVIKSTNATHGQLVINTPTGENMFSEVIECHDGKVVFVITKEMIDELIEVGFYSFQIRLFDESQVSRVTIPPVLKGIDIRNPIAAEDETNVVDIGLVDYAVVVKDEFEDLSTFLPDGNYNKTEWKSKDVISGAKLNKIEDALYNINSNMEATDLALLNKVENINKNVYREIDKLGNELESEVEEFERSLNTNVEQFKMDTNAQLSSIDLRKVNKEDLAKLSSATPIFVNDINEMNDSTKNYVNLSDGYIYVFMNDKFVKTNIKYQEMGISDGQITLDKINPNNERLLFMLDNIEFNRNVRSIKIPAFRYWDVNEREWITKDYTQFPSLYPDGFNFELTETWQVGRLYFDYVSCQSGDNPFIFKTDGTEVEFEPNRYQLIASMTFKGLNTSYHVKDVTPNHIESESLPINGVKVEHLYPWLDQRLYTLDSIKIYENENCIVFPSFKFFKDGSWIEVSPNSFPIEHPTGTFEFKLDGIWDVGHLYYDHQALLNRTYPFVWMTRGNEKSPEGDRYRLLLRLSANGIETPYRVETANNKTGFNQAEDTLLLPPKLFMINDEPLRIYKRSLLRHIANTSPHVFISSEFDDINKLPYYKEILDVIEVNSDDLSDTLKLFITDLNNGKMYGRELLKVSKSLNQVIKKSPIISNFGDSVTALGISSNIKANLHRLDLTPSFIGTVNDDLGTKCEARAGWMYAHYIGLRTVDTSGEPITNFPNFLKLATEEDKQNHPNWCFRRTFTEKELSYAEDTDKTGDFYIFDYENYLTINHFTTPDVVTIAMGTNDFWKIEDVNEAIETCKLAIEIMCTQMVKANPNIKIGVIPHHTWGSSDTYNIYNEISLWNNECQLKVYDLANSLDLDIEFVACYMSQSPDLSFPFDKGEFISNTQNQVFSMTDSVHPTNHGTKEYGRALSYFIINKI